MDIQNSEIMKKLFGPLDGQWCLYFYVLAVISFVFLVMSVGNLVMCLFSKKKMNMTSVLATIQLLIAYFINRLLYSMCASSLSGGF
tara:strand:- start:316 stop:573 length:258 start_codon:yes stop_codon:yes gene_type:complete